MKLADIKNSLMKHQDDHPFVLDITSTGIGEITQFFSQSLGIGGISLKNVTISGDQEVAVSGNASIIGFTDLWTVVTFSETKDHLSIQMMAKMPDDWAFGLPLIDWLSIGEFSITLRMDLSELNLTGSMNGTIHFKKVQADIPIAIQLPVNRYGWLVEAKDQQIKIPGLTELALLVEMDSIMTYIPPGLDQVITGLSITDIAISFNVKENRVNFIRFGAQSNDTWRIFSDKFKVNEFQLYLLVNQPFSGQSSTSIVFQMWLNIFDSPLPFLMEKSDSQWVMRIADKNGIGLPRLSDLGALIGGYNLAQLLPEDLTNLGTLTLYDLAIGFDLSPAQQSLAIFEFKLAVFKPWRMLGIQALVIDNIMIDFTLANPTDKAKRTITGGISATLNFYDLNIEITAEYPGDGAGWIFEGWTRDSQGADLNDLVNQLLSSFSLDPLPSQIPKVIIKNLRVSFNTTDQSFSLIMDTDASGKASSGINLYDVEGMISLQSNLDKTSGTRTLAGSVEGKLTIGHSVFQVKYQFGQKNTPGLTNQAMNLLTASWEATNDETFGVNDLLEVLSIGDKLTFPAGLDLSLKKVAFSYHIKEEKLVLTANSTRYGTAFFVSEKDSDGNRGYIFGVDYRGDLKLSGLPVIGGYLTAVDCITLKHFRIIAASSDFTDYEIPDLPPLKGPNPTKGAASTGEAPPKEPKQKLQAPKGISLNAVVDLIGSSQTFNLHLDENAANNEITPALNQKAGSPGAQETKTKNDLAAAPGGSSNDQDSPKSSSPKAVWINIQKSFGPVYFHQIGISYRDSKISFLLDARFAAASLDVELTNLALSFPLDNPLDYVVDLMGLDIDFASGPVEINGGLLKNPDSSLLYEGEALMKLGNITISALGSYTTQSDGQPSLFVFAMLSYPLGGPPYFYVTGLATGFGYNRGLKIPGPKELEQFPLVAAARGKSETLTCKTKPMDALNTMSDYIAVAEGADWVAAGVRFTSFELVNSFALLTISFGTTLEIALLGLSTIDAPSSSNPIAHANLALEAVITPDSGLLPVRGALTSDSFILDPDCKLTGGFAFYLWFGGEHAGDFVITLGGYHPNFIKPSHYPSVDRLAFNWKRGNLTLKGDAYFALTPSCIMAGCSLDAIYQWGNLRAWFSAYADFLIQWKPFHYDIMVGASLGASYRVDFLFVHHTFSIELSASLHLYGPEFSGEVHVNWFIISFTISFGDSDNAKPKPLSWEEFCQSFLPHPDKQSTGARAPQGPKTAVPEAMEPTVCDIQVSKGLIREIKHDGQPSKWVINAQNCCIITHSVIPSTAMTFNKTDLKLELRKLGIRPMGSHFSLDSTHNVTLRRLIKKDPEKNVPSADKTELEDSPDSPETYWEDVPVAYETVLENVPESLWSPVELTGPSANTIANIPVGLKLTPLPISYSAVPKNGSYDLATLIADEDVNDTIYSWGNLSPAPRLPFPTEDPVTTLKETIQSPSVSANRNQALDALLQNGFQVSPGAEIRVDEYGANAENFLIAPPWLINLGAQAKG